MKSKFYIGQPLIIKETGEKVVLYYNDGGRFAPYHVLGDSGGDCKEYHDLEPSTEFKFSEIIAGLEQGYFEVGTEFHSEYQTFVVCKTIVGLGLKNKGGNPTYAEVIVNSDSINSTWTLVEPRKEMTLEEIEAELGYKIKLKDNGEMMIKGKEWLKGRIKGFQEGENMFTAEFNAGVQDALEYVQ